jgi:hypothetical protein
MAAKDTAARTVVPLNTTGEASAPRSIVAQLERAALEHQAQGDAVGHGIISELAVAAGMLKYKTAAALGKVSGETGELLERLHKLL